MLYFQRAFQSGEKCYFSPYILEKLQHFFFIFLKNIILADTIVNKLTYTNSVNKFMDRLLCFMYNLIEGIINIEGS